jgi:hypothetical protein
MKRSYQLRAKLTPYNGIVFRSQLEARWAVFFDSLGIEYDYEPHSYEVGTGGRYVQYKPDFFLPGLSKYIEIKRSKPTDLEHLKCAGWTRDIGDIYTLFNLNPPTDGNENGWKYDHDGISNRAVSIAEDQCWGECSKCGKVDIEDYGDITSCGCFSDDYYNEKYEDSDVLTTPDQTHTERLIRAYRKAKNHKFHGGGKRKVPKITIQCPLF